eukprot:gnl/MRDRNA2_/MRDRNA2_62149_c0_seq1.p1 gnl/MRDRNA2_/MRDRNA2_62149_c0~~gnl/MRDRNA2_/MRDRNA2_62149_c0_seq1.p1  ORF type:complete len:284 (-),score=39.96 gnl/MRDRNA2_/MRDRNA2_62149_c0_seq1:420-1271(-)
MTCFYQPMSTNLTHHSLRLLESQVTWLSERQCRIRGTFIEIKPEACPSRRTSSMPPTSRCSQGLELSEELAVSPTLQQSQDAPSGASSSSTGSSGNPRPTTLSLFDRLGCKNPGVEVAAERPKSPRSDTVSTTCSWRETEEMALIADKDSASTTSSENDSQLPADEIADRINALAKVVKEECSFLRISGHRLCLTRPQGPGGVGRNGPGALAITLCVFVQGLPWTKRAKWRQPLLRSAASALDQAGVHAVVSGGNLHINLPGLGRHSHSHNHIHVQLDFAAAR